ncbi:mechanosensitive ion channel family protein [Endozoicomonas sp. G2_1]|uniref:mechanosensitive ion channel family protein n=1 Tax=Endozoicomonas sp. G2_1 TaxID=2821091 RepID=UPI001ADB9005|nr:mechanosensitive ion channel family protein [Endozoicomonas sp. G2_1]MBO9491217.1 mechanosensitive ion channel family protein [Endozoicomonas sp. G2_1]
MFNSNDAPEASPTTTNDAVTSLAPSELLKEEIDQVTKYYDLIIDFFANYSFQLVGAFLIFLFGYFVAGKVGKLVLRVCEKQSLDITLSRFLANTSKMVVVVLITIVALGKLGISVTPFVAAIGAVTLGASLALQGLLANYASGFNIILLRPFVVGDTIQVQGVKGVVKEVLLAYTILQDEDNVEITIPNKHIVGEILHNSKHDSLLELSIGISYDDNPIDAIALIEKTISELNITGEQKQLQVGIDEFADSSINIGIRLWTPTNNLYANKYQANQAIYGALKQASITIPYPQRDVHLIQQAS